MVAVIWCVVIVLLGAVVWRLTGRREEYRGGTGLRIGSAAAGIFYGMLSEDKRNAIEIIVEERAEARDPEDKDGNLPDLANPRKPRIPNP